MIASRAPLAVDPLRPFTVGEKAALAREISSSYARARWWLRSGTLERAAVSARNGREPSHRDDRAAADYHVGLRLGRVVERRLAHLPGDTRCLTRSLVLLRMLARRNIIAHLVIGALADDGFSAHAWVELDGHPLLNPGEYQAGRLTEI